MFITNIFIALLVGFTCMQLFLDLPANANSDTIFIRRQRPHKKSLLERKFVFSGAPTRSQSQKKIDSHGISQFAAPTTSPSMTQETQAPKQYRPTKKAKKTKLAKKIKEIDVYDEANWADFAVESSGFSEEEHSLNVRARIK